MTQSQLLLRAGDIKEIYSQAGIDSDELSPELQRQFEVIAKLAYSMGHQTGQEAASQVDLVWSGPEPSQVYSRSTPVVCRELFREARSEVIVSSFAVHQGKTVFQELAANMDSNESLRVMMFLNVPRKPGSTSTPQILLNEFKNNFLKREWPGKREPELFYDPRSMDLDSKKRSSLHAKCIVIDRRICFATSANMTEAAQLRNVEAGFIIRNELVAKQLAAHFEVLVEMRHFVRF